MKGVEKLCNKINFVVDKDDIDKMCSLYVFFFMLGI